MAAESSGIRVKIVWLVVNNTARVWQECWCYATVYFALLVSCCDCRRWISCSCSGVVSGGGSDIYWEEGGGREDRQTLFVEVVGDGLMV
jgi:hypothetical protein